MLVIASLDSVHDAYRRWAPARVVSLLSEDEETPAFDGLAPAAHLKLHVDQESCARSINDAARRRAAEIVAFVAAWDGHGHILVHCARGVSRSTAAAFIILCMREPDARPADLMARIRTAAPHADPCPLLVAYADEILGRNGEMIEAVEDLCPPSPTISAPETQVPLAA